jgi:hypothetical protein
MIYLSLSLGFGVLLIDLLIDGHNEYLTFFRFFEKCVLALWDFKY